MKRFFTLVFLAAAIMAAASPQLKQVSTVYILAMGSGMDQFLANQLTTAGVFAVVTDPQRADAILTDRLGEPFENKLKELYPPPKPDVDAAKPAKDAKKEDADLSGSAARVTSIGTGKGNFFLVDRKNRSVLWSIYERPKDSTPGELSKTAGKVVKRLKSDLEDKSGT